MSIKRFLAHIFGELRKFWTRLKPGAKKAIIVGVTVVENIKAIMDSPVGNIIEALVPDNLLSPEGLIKVRATLPKILLELQLAATCTAATTPEEIVACALKTLQQMEGDWISDAARRNFYDSIAVTIAMVAADGELTWDDIKYVLKWYYDHVQKAQK